MNNFINNILPIIYEAGNISKKFFYDQKEVKIKNDFSKVTTADVEINNYLIQNLKYHYPTFDILSEENSTSKQLESIENNNFFIIDPIDGTNSFIEGSSEYSINLSLVCNHKLILSVIYLPIDDILYFSDKKNTYKYENYENFSNNKKEKIYIKNIKNRNYISLVCTRREDEIIEIKNFLKKSLKKFNFHHISSSKKFCILSESKVDIYIRKSNIKLWDIAAGFHIAFNSGLIIEDFNGNNLYKKFLTKEYLEGIKNNKFKIDEFIIKPKDLEIF